ncbi:MAG: hypothetical protein ACRDTT_21530 [Pseudonocardiaceae bacterium]
MSTWPFIRSASWALSLAGYPRNEHDSDTYLTRRGAQPARSYTWVDGEPRNSTFACHGIGAGTIELELVIEGDEPAGVERDVRIGPLDGLFLVRQGS